MVRVEHLYASSLSVYFPTPLFFWLGLGQLPLGVVRLAGVVLLGALLSAACGGLTRLALTLAWISFFLFYGTILGFEKPEPPAISPYTFHYNNVVPFHLFVLSVSPGIARWGAHELWRWGREEQGLHSARPLIGSVPAWPMLLVKFTLALAYFGSGLAKVKASGILWMDGYTLQAHFLTKHLQEEAWIGYWLAQSYWVCVVLSVCTLALELSFIIVPFLANRRPLTWVYVIAGLGFHILTAVTMKIVHFLPFMGLSYLIFLDWPILQKYVRVFCLRLAKESEDKCPEQAQISSPPTKGETGTPRQLWILRGFIGGYLGTLVLCDIVGIELWPFSDYGVFRERAHYSQIHVGQLRGVDETTGAYWLRASDLGDGFDGWADGANFIRFYMAHSGRTTRMPTMEKNGDFVRDGPRFLKDFYQRLPPQTRERFHTLEFVVRSIKMDPDGWLISSDEVLFSTDS
jgi:hypothetical protein